LEKVGHSSNLATVCKRWCEIYGAMFRDKMMRLQNGQYDKIAGHNDGTRWFLSRLLITMPIGRLRTVRNVFLVGGDSEQSNIRQRAATLMMVLDGIDRATTPDFDNRIATILSPDTLHPEIEKFEDVFLRERNRLLGADVSKSLHTATGILEMIKALVETNPLVKGVMDEVERVRGQACEFFAEFESKSKVLDFESRIDEIYGRYPGCLLETGVPITLEGLKDSFYNLDDGMNLNDECPEEIISLLREIVKSSVPADIKSADLLFLLTLSFAVTSSIFSGGSYRRGFEAFVPGEPSFCPGVALAEDLIKLVPREVWDFIVHAIRRGGHVGEAGMFFFLCGGGRGANRIPFEYVFAVFKEAFQSCTFPLQGLNFWKEFFPGTGLGLLLLLCAMRNCTPHVVKDIINAYMYLFHPAFEIFEVEGIASKSP